MVRIEVYTFELLCGQNKAGEKLENENPFENIYSIHELIGNEFLSLVSLLQV